MPEPGQLTTIFAPRERIVAQLPGLAMPMAYGVARKDGSKLTFRHVNM